VLLPERRRDECEDEEARTQILSENKDFGEGRNAPAFPNRRNKMTSARKQKA